MRKWVVQGLLGLIAVLGVAALLAVDFVSSFQHSLPPYSGVAKVAGLAAPVQILRDRYAIPHIVAGSYEDAAFALGYAHAQDRLWQMEMSRRFVQGRLSELLGELALTTDVMMRAMDLYTAAEDAVDHLSRDSQRTLSAYADGVNAYIAGHKGRWPIEFVVTGDTPPDLWRPADSVAVLKGMAFQLSGNAFTEAARAQLVSVLGEKSIQDFFPPFSAAPLPSYVSEIFGATRTGLAYGVPDTTASDNWTVDGAHSVTGKPLLANDPHLGFTIPSVWYLAHVAVPGEDIAGGTLAGVPAIIIGHNRHVAWGVTNTGPDTQDLYLERIDPDDALRYQTPSGFAMFDTRAETIKVRFGRERQVRLRATRHGPVISDAAGTSFAAAAPQGYALALAWTALEPDDTTLDGLLGINRATNAAEFKSAASAIVSPMQNIVYADDGGASGHIGLVLPGRVPLRSDKNDSLGLVPAPGWDGKYDWQGAIPRDKFVSIADPKSGHIASANNKTAPEDYPYTLTREWEANYRYDRVETLLLATPKHSASSFKQMQTDVVDNYALALKKRLIEAGNLSPDSSVTPDASAAARLIESWDGSMRADRKEPLIFAAWARALAKRIYADELGPNFPRFWGYRDQFTLRVLDNVDGEGRWCDDKSTPEVETCRDMIRLALNDALAEIQGGTVWGDVHKAIHRAQPFGSFPWIGGFFNREVTMDGGPYTLLRADNAMASPTPYAAIHGAGYRGIYDLANPDRSLFIVSTGQSGNLFSPHYDDQLKLWAKGEYVLIPTSPDIVAEIAVERLTLEPAQETLSTTP